MQPDLRDLIFFLPRFEQSRTSRFGNLFLPLRSEFLFRLFRRSRSWRFEEIDHEFRDGFFTDFGIGSRTPEPIHCRIANAAAIVSIAAKEFAAAGFIGETFEVALLG